MVRPSVLIIVTLYLNIVYIGMHGTVEWLPGSPLGSTDTSWPDQLLGDIPNLYVYAANNPSESILSKRRGYSTIISYNVPPYARAGLYKDLNNIRELVSDYRADRSPSAIPLIAALLERTDLYKDIPFKPTKVTDVPANMVQTIPDDGILTPAMAEDLLQGSKSSAFIDLFDEYCARLTNYLIELENRIFSQGLHVIGEDINARKVFGYLQAVFSKSSSEETAVKEDLVLSDFVLYAIASEATRLSPIAEIRSKARLAEALRASFNGVSNLPEKMSFDEIDAVWLQIHDANAEWEPRSQIDYTDLLDEDSKFMLHLATSKGVQAALRYSFLLFQSNWGSRLADDEMYVLKRVGMKGIDDKGRLSVDINPSTIESAINLAQTLVRYSNEEIDSLLRGLNGEYIAAAPGGDLIRDGM